MRRRRSGPLAVADDARPVRPMAYHACLERSSDDDVVTRWHCPAGAENSDVGIGVTPDSDRDLVAVFIPGLRPADRRVESCDIDHRAVPLR